MSSRIAFICYFFFFKDTATTEIYTLSLHDALPIFYQPHGLVHGRAQITAADDSRTQILGNYRFDYQKDPVQCVGASWFQRVFTPSHMQSQCDPRLWTQVEGLVRQQMEPQSIILAVLPQP